MILNPPRAKLHFPPPPKKCAFLQKNALSCAEKMQEINLASRWEGVRLPRASGKSPRFPGSSPNFPGGQPLFLGSLTPSPDSHKLSCRKMQVFGGHMAGNCRKLQDSSWVFKVRALF